MSYCTIDDVVKAFPNFQRNATGSVQDADIEKWIANWAARIDAALAERGVNLDTFVASARQLALLAALNEDGAVAELGSALQGTLTLQPGEYSVPASRRRSAEAALKQIIAGGCDVLFGMATATPATTSKFGGIGGAETAKEDTPEALEENRAFGKNQEF